MPTLLSESQIKEKKQLSRPSFSIITACYNPGPLIRSAIESVISQSYPDIEYIIIDGGSDKETIDIISSYRNGITTFVSEADNSIYDALNKGLSYANGDIIGFLHADDMYADRDVLARVAEAFEGSDTDSVYGDLVYVSKENTEQMIRYWKSGNFDKTKLKYGWMPPHTAFFVKRDIYNQVLLSNGQYFDTSLSIAADYDFMMRLLGKLGISTTYLAEVLVKMRTGGCSNNSLLNIITKSREDYIIMKRNHIGGFLTLLFKNIRKIPQFFTEPGSTA